MDADCLVYYIRSEHYIRYMLDMFYDDDDDDDMGQGLEILKNVTLYITWTLCVRTQSTLMGSGHHPNARGDVRAESAHITYV